MKKNFGRCWVLLSLGLVTLSGCSSDSDSGDTGITLDGAVRLNWFYSSLTSGDPASGPTPSPTKALFALSFRIAAASETSTCACGFSAT